MLATATGASTNNLTGGLAADSIVGGAGVNVITTTGGNDTLTGGAGDDDFVINGAISAQTVVITDLGTDGDSISTTSLATVNATVTSCIVLNERSS